MKMYNKLLSKFKNKDKETLLTKKGGVLTFIDYKRPLNKFIYIIMILILVSVALTALLPIFILLLSSYKGPSELYAIPFNLFPQAFDITKMFTVWQEVQFEKYLFNTLIVCFGAAFVGVIVNGLLAYSVSVVKPWGHKFFYILIMASYMIPGILSIVPLYSSIVNLSLTNTYIPLWFVMGANAFYFILFKNHFDSIPGALIEAARVDGASNIRIFFSVIIPMSKSIMLLVAIFSITTAWNDFLLPYLVLQDSNMQTIMVLLYQKSGDAQFSPDKLLMLSLISIIPQIIIFFVFQKQIVGSAMSSGLKE